MLRELRTPFFKIGALKKPPDSSLKSRILVGCFILLIKLINDFTKFLYKTRKNAEPCWIDMTWFGFRQFWWVGVGATFVPLPIQTFLYEKRMKLYLNRGYDQDFSHQIMERYYRTLSRNARKVNQNEKLLIIILTKNFCNEEILWKPQN